MSSTFVPYASAIQANLYSCFFMIAPLQSRRTGSQHMLMEVAFSFPARSVLGTLNIVSLLEQAIAKALDEASKPNQLAFGNTNSALDTFYAWHYKRCVAIGPVKRCYVNKIRAFSDSAIKKFNGNGNSKSPSSCSTIE